MTTTNAVTCPLSLPACRSRRAFLTLHRPRRPAAGAGAEGQRRGVRIAEPEGVAAVDVDRGGERGRDRLGAGDVQQAQVRQADRAGHLDGDLAAGHEVAGVRGDDGGIAGDGLPGERCLRDLGCLGAGGGGGAGQGRGAGGLLGGAVDVEPGLHQAAGRDREQQQEDQERGDQHQLGSRRAPLPGLRPAGARAGGAGHGGHPCAVAGTNRSTGPVTVTVTGKLKTGHGQYPLGGPGDLDGDIRGRHGDGDLRAAQHAAADLADDLGCPLLAAGGGAALDAGGGQRLLGRGVRDALGVLPDGELDDQQDQQHQQRHRDDGLGAARAPVAVRPGPFRPPRMRSLPARGRRAAGAGRLIRG